MTPPQYFVEKVLNLKAILWSNFNFIQYEVAKVLELKGSF